MRSLQGRDSAVAAPEIAANLPLIKAGNPSRPSPRRTYAFKTSPGAHSLTASVPGGRAVAPPGRAFGLGKVTVEIWTHKIDGLTSDFVFAAKCDVLQASPA